MLNATNFFNCRKKPFYIRIREMTTRIFSPFLPFNRPNRSHRRQDRFITVVWLASRSFERPTTVEWIIEPQTAAGLWCSAINRPYHRRFSGGLRGVSYSGVYLGSRSWPEEDCDVPDVAAAIYIVRKPLNLCLSPKFSIYSLPKLSFVVNVWLISLMD